MRANEWRTVDTSRGDKKGNWEFTRVEKFFHTDSTRTDRMDAFHICFASRAVGSAVQHNIRAECILEIVSGEKTEKIDLYY
jgi:hypothetical protein